jgi:hypothetical protein
MYIIDFLDTKAKIPLFIVVFFFYNMTFYRN